MSLIRNQRTKEYRELAAILLQLRNEMLEAEAEANERLNQLHTTFRESGRNLVHYLVLRQTDLRSLQNRLAAQGLSSLGRAESHVLATLDRVLQTLCELAGDPLPEPVVPSPLSYEEGRQLLHQHTSDLLNHTPPNRSVRIMVTMPSEAAEDYHLVHDLLDRGMDCMRINCAHDGPAQWQRMIGHLAQARKSLGKPCVVQMDLGGPKIRTGPLQAGQAVLHLRPQRDALGRVLQPLRIWLTGKLEPYPPPSPADGVLQVDNSWLAGLTTGDVIKLEDARGARRRWQTIDVTDGGTWVSCGKSMFLTATSELHNDHGSTTLGALPKRVDPLLLQAGDRLIVTRNQRPGRPATHDSVGKVLTPACIGCTLPGAFDHVEPGQPILFDDGRIAGVIEQVDTDQVVVRIDRTAPNGSKLSADKGVNLPDSDLQLAALTAEDLENLAFVVEHADIIGLSFVNRAADIDLLQEQVERLGKRRPGIVLKIETRRGFESLPDILLAAMRNARCGVMIARGDLAVECGFGRLAEAQEEILWLCEAAHVPVVWATQVLESLAKKGLPSRAEITDAAMGDRAECVMLNKGPHIRTAVEMLDDILARMQSHQAKKQSMLRKLNIARRMPIADGNTQDGTSE